MTEDPVGRLEAATAVAQQALDAVAEDQWALPSTCSGWDVERLAGHLVEGTESLASALGAAPEPAGSSWPERHRAAAAALVDGMRAPGALERPVTVPAGTMPGAMVAGLRTVEALVHAWDLATSTGRRLEPADDLVAYAEELTRRLLERLPADRRPFAEPTTAPPGAARLDRLAATLGRRVP